MTSTRCDCFDRTGELLDVGEQLFAEIPYTDVTLDQVAEKAGVSRAVARRR